MHDMGAADRGRLLRQRIAAMDADDFEQLVFELAHREDPRVRRLKAPDGGADTLRPADDDEPAKVWQAKHYPSNIAWSKCRKSLADAIKRWVPSEVVFAFPRDLTQGQEKAYEEKLEQHPDAVKEGVALGVWNQSELVRRLNEHEDLRARFFGPEQEQMLAVMDRTARAGGILASPKDLVERAKTLNEYAERQDRRFATEVRSSGLEVPAPKWDELPHMVLQVADATTRVTIAAFPREGAEIAPSVFGFYGNEAGQKARMRAVETLARGEPAEVTEGAHVQLDAPELMAQLAPQEQLGDPVFTIAPEAPLLLGIEVMSEGGVPISREVDLYNVPPPPNAHGALAGYSGEVLVQVTIRLLEEPRIRLEVNFTGSFGADMRKNAEAAELLLAFYTAPEVTLRNDMLFPNGVMKGPLSENAGEDRVRELRSQEALFATVVLIEDRLGVAITPPPQVTPDDVEALVLIREALETGEGVAEFTEMRATVEAAVIPIIAAQQSGTIHQKPVTYDLFGGQLNIGVGAYELPKLKVVGVKPHTPLPNSPADVVLRADGDPMMRFRLL